MVLSKKRIKEILEFKDEDISDIPELTDEQLAEMKPASFYHHEWYKPVKKKVCMYIDADIVEWYKAKGKGYQTQINKVLRADMLRESVQVYRSSHIEGEKKDK